MPVSLQRAWWAKACWVKDWARELARSGSELAARARAQTTGRQYGSRRAPLSAPGENMPLSVDLTVASEKLQPGRALRHNGFCRSGRTAWLTKFARFTHY